MGRVDGRIAIVTGAASGIGRACARLLAREGATVVVTDRDLGGGQAAAAELGAPHTFRALDVTDPAAWASAVDETVRALGRLDILVNAAGIATLNDIEHATLDEWRRVNAVNGEGTFLGCQAAVRAMKGQGGGSIVNVSSVAGIVADPDMAVYCASKAAVRLLTKSVALHAARAGYGIRCNSVHPAFIATPMVDAMLAAPSAGARGLTRQKLERAVPLGRIGEADDVAHAVVYLASDESRFVTGAELVVDGGLSAR
ncbi:MAG TPA: glucose 1-dehydrogenase [Kofleriaceae bacterium]|nr:glucose 1-dehydrogenase [Kofleriaceae bacterium]